MEQSQKYVNNFLLLGMLIVGLVIGVVATNSNQELRTRAQNAPVTIVSPEQGTNVSDIMVVKAQTSTQQDIQRIRAVIRIDGEEIQDMRVDRVDSQTIQAIAAWNTNRHTLGNHALEVLFYDTSSNPAIQIGSTSIPVTIGPR